MRIHYKDINEFMEVSDEQYIELVEIGAIDKAGFWILEENNWVLYAIGMNQIPGSFVVEVDLDTNRKLH